MKKVTMSFMLVLLSISGLSAFAEDDYGTTLRPEQTHFVTAVGMDEGLPNFFGALARIGVKSGPFEAGIQPMVGIFTAGGAVYGKYDLGEKTYLIGKYEAISSYGSGSFKKGQGELVGVGFKLGGGTSLEASVGLQQGENHDGSKINGYAGTFGAIQAF